MDERNEVNVEFWFEIRSTKDEQNSCTCDSRESIDAQWVARKLALKSDRLVTGLLFYDEKNCWCNRIFMSFLSMFKEQYNSQTHHVIKRKEKRTEQTINEVVQA